MPQIRSSTKKTEYQKKRNTKHLNNDNENSIVEN